MCALIGRVGKPTPSVFHRETGRFSPHSRSTTLSISPQKTRHSNNNIFSRVVSAPPCEPTINSSDDNSCVEFDSLVTEATTSLFLLFFFLTSTRYFRNRLIPPFLSSFSVYIRYFIFILDLTFISGSLQRGRVRSD